MDDELSERDRKLVSKIQSMKPSAFQTNRVIGIVFLGLSLVGLIVLACDWLGFLPGELALRGTTFFFISLATFVMGLGAIQVARLQRIIHSLTNQS